jgi:hypothetical protein
VACQSLAAAASLSGTYKAWLSTSQISAKQRLNYGPNDYFVRRDNVVVANSWVSLLSGSLLSPIDCDERGTCGQAGGVWTDTGPDGSSGGPGAQNCSDWRSTQGIAITFGDPTQTNSAWTAVFPEGGVPTCSDSLHLYCFSSPPSAYLMGCFTDTTSRDLSGPSDSSLAQTPEQCTAWCAGQGYEYAGVQYGSQCFCGNSFGSCGSSSACTMPCSGNSNETCGGVWANSVYKTDYLGCFADSTSRDLSGPSDSCVAQTPEQCMAWCAGQGYEYAGVQYGSQCFCGDSFGTYGPSSACTMPCSGNSNETCGGVWANSVYKTGY